MDYLIFNPNYILKPDDGKTLILSALVGRNSEKGITDSFTNVIHPIYAMILSFIDGREREVCINQAASALDVPTELVSNFVDKVTNNQEQIYLKSGDGISSFPPNTIISIESESTNHRYEPELFEYNKVNLQMGRHKTPSSLTFMFNNICKTDCIYCYQDKTRKVSCTIPLDRIIELIHEAKDLHVNTIDVIGGEFFLYKHWKEVLSELRRLGYNPYLSTKIPLKEEDVKFLSELRIHDIQISIDSFIEDHLTTSLRVHRGYASEMQKSLHLLDQYGVPVMVHTVLTQFNDTIEDMLSIYNEIKTLNHLVDWHVVKGDESLYPKTDYSNIEINASKLNSLIDFLEELNQQGEVKIHFPEKVAIQNNSVQKSSDFTKKVLLKAFFNRSFCSGLFSSLYILPDGKVTMCEQLYWNKNFIIGNVLTQSISDIWNSEKANHIFYISQDDIPEDSLCRTCDKFSICRSVRQVCYREIIRKYGKDKWYYPDVNCPFANK